MLYASFEAYKKELQKEEFHGAICENSFFGILATEAGLEKEHGEEILRKLASEIAEQKIEHLVDFDAYIADFCKKVNLPARFSLACGYLTQDVFFLKTIGRGVVYIKRKREISKLLEKDSNASGYVEDADTFAFTLDKKSEDEESLLTKALEKPTLSQAVETLSAIVQEKNSEDRIALFVSFEKKEPMLTSQDEHLIEDTTASSMASQMTLHPPSRLTEFFAQVKSQLQGQQKEKKITLIVVIVVLVVFVWSVIFGYQRRTSAALDQKTKETKELVVEKLRQADDVAFLNLARATALIAEAKEDVVNLKKELKGKKQNEVSELEKLVSEKEEKILKKEERSAEEYFDLSVEDEHATGSKIYLDGDTAIVLDKRSGTAYILSLSKKSLDKRRAAEIRGGDLITRSQDNVLVYKRGSGIVSVGSDGKAKKAIENDSDGGDIVAMIAYNNNLYTLDEQKSDVYKYVPAEKGFSEKSSYFKGQDKPNLTDANSLAIDLSVYIGFPDGIIKFTSGAKEGFNPTFPESGINIIKILTTKDIEKIYGWDKKKSALYVINKSGVYERQINSSVLAKGDDVIVFGTNAYILQGPKIYKVSVD